MKKKICFAGVFLTAVLPACGGVWYFSPDGSDENYGNVRSAPRRSFNAWTGLYRFRSGDTIYLLPGTHNTIRQGYHGESWLKFDFVGIDEDGNPAEPGEVVIDGGGTNSCVAFGHLKEWNFRNITFRNGVNTKGGAICGDINNQYYGNAGIVSNCVFSGCSSTGNGGAVWSSGGQSTFIDCVFTNCTSSGSGGAVYLSSVTGSCDFVRCRFVSNEAVSGSAGALSLSHTGGEAALFGMRLTDCLFTNNVAGVSAGAIQGLVELATNTCFTANRAAGSGGVWYLNGYSSETYKGNCVLTNTFLGCRFDGNSSGAYGGALASVWMKNFRFADCVFSGNSSVNNGGALSSSVQSGSGAGCFSAERCRFTGNTANGSGALALGSITGNVFFTDCVFDGNAATNGSAGVIQASLKSELSEYGLVLDGCAFSNNTASADAGAINSMVHYATNCVFYGNRAVNGGVWYLNGYASSAYAGVYVMTNTFTDCVFETNVAAGAGGVIGFENNKRFSFVNCRFANNAAGGVGGVWAGNNPEDVSLSVRGCSFEGNVSEGTLFAVYGDWKQATRQGPVFEDSAFVSNSAGSGNVITLSACPGRIERCLFTDNDGARVLSVSGPYSFTVRNCLVAGNRATASNGGVVGVEWQAVEKVVFENNTLADNVSAAAPYAVWVDSWKTSGGTASIKNNVFYGNRGGNGVSGTQLAPYFVNNVAYSWIENGGSSVTDGTRGCVVRTDPGFVSDEVREQSGVPAYTVRLGSSARGRGVLLDWMDEHAKDLAGNARVRDGSVDMGCYQCWLEPMGTLVIMR